MVTSNFSLLNTTQFGLINNATMDLSNLYESCLQNCVIKRKEIVQGLVEYNLLLISFINIIAVVLIVYGDLIGDKLGMQNIPFQRLGRFILGSVNILFIFYAITTSII